MLIAFSTSAKVNKMKNKAGDDINDLCKNPKFLGEKSFDIEKMKGLWIPRYVSKDDFILSVFTADKSCTALEFLLTPRKNEKEKTLTLNSYSYPKNSNNQTDRIETGSIIVTQEDPKNVLGFEYTFLRVKYSFIVLDSDYINYAIIYRCSGFNKIEVLILFRKVYLDTTLEDKVYLLTRAKLNTQYSDLKSLNEEGCWYPDFNDTN
jgi:hypothetical protein